VKFESGGRLHARRKARIDAPKNQRTRAAVPHTLSRGEGKDKAPNKDRVRRSLFKNLFHPEVVFPNSLWIKRL
jgi:hypothetical protein